MNKRPFFSVIVPTHKRAILLRRALQSIRSQAATFADFEVIVVSDVIDASTDAVCAELLTGADVYMRRNGRAGPSESRNLALSLAKGHTVLFLDDDDAWHPGCLEQLHAQPSVRQRDPVYFNCSVVTERRLPEGPEPLSEVRLDLAGCLTEDVYVKNQVHMSCFAFPRDLLDGIEFDPFMRSYEDWDYLLSIVDRRMPIHVPLLGSRVYEVRDETTDRRGSSQKANDFNAVLDYLYVYRRHCAPREALTQRRAELLRSCGLSISPDLL
jgi:GalNAc5-diNAcBac-PP-undecaprenol beta-1,3-glucosyltransferase